MTKWETQSHGPQRDHGWPGRAGPQAVVARMLLGSCTFWEKSTHLKGICILNYSLCNRFTTPAVFFKRKSKPTFTTAEKLSFSAVTIAIYIEFIYFELLSCHWTSTVMLVALIFTTMEDKILHPKVFSGWLMLTNWMTWVCFCGKPALKLNENTNAYFSNKITDVSRIFSSIFFTV